MEKVNCEKNPNLSDEWHNGLWSAVLERRKKWTALKKNNMKRVEKWRSDTWADLKESLRTELKENKGREGNGWTREN